MTARDMFLMIGRGSGKSQLTYQILKYYFKEEKNMEKKCKFKVGDMVINNGCTWYVHTGPGFVGKVVEVMNDGVHMRVKGKSVTAPNAGLDDIRWIVSIYAFDLYDPHEGKILIMVDEKNNNKIVARNLLTGKMAEAKCSPKDEWDFNKGAKLALERLTEPEKPKGWTGKVVLVESEYDTVFFTQGKVYKVENGSIIDNTGTPYETSYVITSLDNLNEHFKDPRYGSRKFIEYKGEVTAE